VFEEGFMHLRDFFDRIYVLNLPTRPDRRRDVTAQLARAGLPPEPGKVEFFSAYRFDHDGGFPTLGARGCFVSHLSILRRARALNLRNVCVIEDDQNFSPRLAADQHPLLDHLTLTDWGIAHFGYRIPLRDTNAETLALGRRLAATPPGRPDQATFLRVRPTEEVLTTAFYAVNAPAFDRLIACLEAILSRPPGHPDGGPMHVDGAYNTFRRTHPDVAAFIATPACSDERPSRSDVSPGRLDRLPLIGSLLQIARNTKRLLSPKPSSRLAPAPRIAPSYPSTRAIRFRSTPR
jgi:GR25 family glycosyltransferase involved in LPS biosynthesis